MNHSLPKTLLYSAYRLSAVHLAPDGTSKLVHGTCFHVTADREVYIITNKHIFSLAHANQKYVGYTITGLQISGYFGVGQYAECNFAGQTMSFAMPRNEAEDVVVIDSTNVPFHFRRKRRAGEHPSTRTATLSPIAVDLGMLATEQDLRKLNPGDPVAFPSYPELYDRDGARPIMRMGSIASDPESNYQTNEQAAARRIACEAHSTQGSSGSPVFSIVNDSDVIVLGINAGHLTGDEPKIGTIHSGLSYCFKSACIAEAIERVRLTRKAA